MNEYSFFDEQRIEDFNHYFIELLDKPYFSVIRKNRDYYSAVPVAPLSFCSVDSYLLDEGVNTAGDGKGN